MTTGCEALDAPGSPGARPNAAAIGRRPGRTGGRAIGRIADTVALEGAMERWGDTVLRLAVSRMGNAADAEDVFQTVFMRLLQASEAFEDDDHLKAWPLRVTINCCNDVHRSPGRSAAPSSATPRRPRCAPRPSPSPDASPPTRTPRTTSTATIWPRPSPASPTSSARWCTRPTPKDTRPTR